MSRVWIMFVFVPMCTIIYPTPPHPHPTHADGDEDCVQVCNGFERWHTPPGLMVMRCRSASSFER